MRSAKACAWISRCGSFSFLYWATSASVPKQLTANMPMKSLCSFGAMKSAWLMYGSSSFSACWRSMQKVAAFLERFLSSNTSTSSPFSARAAGKIPTTPLSVIELFLIISSSISLASSYTFFASLPTFSSSKILGKPRFGYRPRSSQVWKKGFQSMYLTTSATVYESMTLTPVKADLAGGLASKSIWYRFLMARAMSAYLRSSSPA
mmetsp:Transcript_40563/g.91146  ORF Transcript_40563/g.91146 Transcript_40563/m.91146 type:complete len:206 (+) Transcript_40563:859-1476(+)